MMMMMMTDSVSLVEEEGPLRVFFLRLLPPPDS